MYYRYCCSGGSNRCTYLACTSSLGNGANHPGRLANGGVRHRSPGVNLRPTLWVACPVVPTGPDRSRSRSRTGAGVPATDLIT